MSAAAVFCCDGIRRRQMRLRHDHADSGRRRGSSGRSVSRFSQSWPAGLKRRSCSYACWRSLLSVSSPERSP